VAAGGDFETILEKKPLAPWDEWARPDRRLGVDDWTREIYASLVGGATTSICKPMTEALVKDDIEAAVEVYQNLKTEQSETWSFAENELNMLGYQLLQRGLEEDAIVVFQLNVEVFPEGFNTYDSLAEAYMTAGRNKLAVFNYQRSLELNPDNANATAMLSRLQGE
jgi:tetratricopeptide (TPR) repeat protein